jgi:hypothetical protein
MTCTHVYFTLIFILSPSYNDLFSCCSIPAEAPWVTETQNSARDAKPGPSGTCHNPLKRILEPSPDDSRMDMDGDDNDRLYFCSKPTRVSSVLNPDIF